MWALCSPSILASPVLAALAPHSPGCLHFPHQSACDDVLAFSLPDSQAREPLRAGAKAAWCLLVSSGLCSEHAGELSRRTPCLAREADAETVREEGVAGSCLLSRLSRPHHVLPFRLFLWGPLAVLGDQLQALAISEGPLPA